MSLESQMGAFERLSTREKSLVLAMLLAGSLLLVVLASWWVGGAIEEVENDLAFNDEMLVDIKAASESYLAMRAKIQEYERMLNDVGKQSLRVTISNVADRIEVEGPADREGNIPKRKLSDQIVFEKEHSKIMMGPSLKKTSKKKKKRTNDDEGNVLRIDQEVHYNKRMGQIDKSGVPISAVYHFLESLELEPMLFVTSLLVNKTQGTLDKSVIKTNKMEITVTTFRSREEE